MAWCGWLMPHGKGCSRTGTSAFGELRFCHQHFEVMLRNMRWAITEQCDEMFNPALASARDALARVDRPKREQAEQAKREREEKRRAQQVVYFVERDGFCKIGYSANLTKRIKDISKGSCLIEGMTVGPVRLLATIPGADMGSEKWMHSRFAHLRVGGEWFLLDDELRTFISELSGCVAEDLKVAS